jgi:hypothetical protein
MQKQGQKHLVKNCAKAVFCLFFMQVVLAKVWPDFRKNRILSNENNTIPVLPNRGTVLDNSLKRRAFSGRRQQHGRTADEAYYGDHQALQAR